MQTAHSVRGDIKISSGSNLLESDLSQLNTLSVGRKKDRDHLLHLKICKVAFVKGTPLVYIFTFLNESIITSFPPSKFSYITLLLTFRIKATFFISFVIYIYVYTNILLKSVGTLCNLFERLTFCYYISS